MSDFQSVMVAMSGGVDSSVAAALYVKAGIKTVGATMKLLPDADCDDDGAQCCSFTGVRDAKRVCDTLGIPHYTLNAVDVFGRLVIGNYSSEYLHGRTPNPCVACNRFAKFGFMLDYAMKMGFDAVATGHYAIMRDGVLYKGTDANKDQSYFLWVVYAADSRRILFPLADLTKPEVREIAAGLSLPTAAKKESQDLCFAGLLPADIFANSHAGPIVDKAGKRIGTHTGIHGYTIGQRKGLGPLGRPMFVKEIDLAANTIVAVDDADLFARGIEIGDLLWCPGEIPSALRYSVKIRYRSTDVPCKIEFVSDGSIRAIFDEPQRAPALGQSAVFYEGERVAGGGIINAIID